MGVFRLLLALSVIASHSTSILGTTLYPGGMAVQIFFMISGFYMAMVLGSRYAHTRQGLALFYSNRALRLYPAFFTVTIATWVQFLGYWAVRGKLPLTDWMPSYESMSWLVKVPLILSNWLLVGTDIFSSMYWSPDRGATFMFPVNPPLFSEAGMTWMHLYRTVSPAWSIGTEIWFYLLVPFLVRARWPTLLSLFALSLACRLWIIHGLERHAYFFFPAQLLFFIGGIASYGLYRTWALPASSQPWHRYVAWVNWALVLAYPWYATWLPQPVHYLLVGLSLPFVFASTKDSPRDRFLGDLSYPVYLIHLSAYNLINRFTPASGLLVACASLLAGLGIMLLVEKPFERLRRRRVEKAQTLVAPSPAGT